MMKGIGDAFVASVSTLSLVVFLVFFFCFDCPTIETVGCVFQALYPLLLQPPQCPDDTGKEVKERAVCKTAEGCPSPTRVQRPDPP